VKRSTNKVLTTHVGSLPELASLDRTAADYPGKLRQQVAAVVQKQREIGLDVINEGEYTKEGDWLSYIEERLAGFDRRCRRPKTCTKPAVSNRSAPTNLLIHQNAVDHRTQALRLHSNVTAAAVKSP